MKKKSKITIGAVCGAIVIGGYTLVGSSHTIDDSITLYNVQKTTYSKIIDEEGNISFDQQNFDPKYLTLEELRKINALEIKSRSVWEKSDNSKEETNNLERRIYTTQFSQEEIDYEFLDDLVLAFEQGQIRDLTRSSINEYCEKKDLLMTEEISSWLNWKLEIQNNRNNVIDFKESENFAEDVMSVTKADYEKFITRPLTPNEKTKQCMPIIIYSAFLGGVVAGSLVKLIEDNKETTEKKKYLK